MQFTLKVEQQLLLIIIVLWQTFIFKLGYIVLRYPEEAIGKFCYLFSALYELVQAS